MPKEANREEPLPSGSFTLWLKEVQASLGAGGAVDVPCGNCTACCRSSQFVHIERKETETFSRIPKELLFPAPGQPEGNMLMGYDEHGCCPMLVDDKCSIYSHRPRTCRTYDCRVFSGAGIAEAKNEKPLIAHQAQRWVFDYPSRDDHARHAAVKAAASFLRKHPECFAGGSASNATHLAVMAIKVHSVFLRLHEEYEKTGYTPDDPEIVRAIARANRNV